MRKTPRQLIARGGVYGLLGVLLAYAFFPVLWMLSTSIKTNLAAYDTPPQWIPSPATLDNYINLWGASSDFGTFFKNTLITSTGSALLSMVVATLSGYAFSRLRFPLKRAVLLGILTTQMFPSVVILISLFVVFRQLGLMDSYLGLILSFTTFSVPFSVWMMKGFCDSVPSEIEEAALIDGCTRLGALRRVVIPIISPGLLAVGLFAFLDGWNSLVFPMALTTSAEMRTIAPGMLMAFAGQFKQDWAGMMAASAVVTIPVIVIFIFLQKYLVEGLSAGAVKG